MAECKRRALPMQTQDDSKMGTIEQGPPPSWPDAEPDADLASPLATDLESPPQLPPAPPAVPPATTSNIGEEFIIENPPPSSPPSPNLLSFTPMREMSIPIDPMLLAISHPQVKPPQEPMFREESPIPRPWC